MERACDGDVVVRSVGQVEHVHVCEGVQRLCVRSIAGNEIDSREDSGDVVQQATFFLKKFQQVQLGQLQDRQIKIHLRR